ncbi:MAG: hypothetical protein KatS3mg097_098 [Candidatus Parcubacteria bacterium]|nr:MAG: hypothetical protein KatS3mg097_098 [Candidatus Parcubacteria bacterium]
MFSNLGLDYKILLLQSLNFLILFFIIYKFFSQPLINVLNKRKQDIEEAYKKVNKAKHIIKKALLFKKKMQREMFLEKERLRQEIDNERYSKLASLEKEMLQHKQKLIDQIKEEELALKANLQKNLEQESFDIFLNLAKKIFTKSKLDREFLNEIFSSNEKN